MSWSKDEIRDLFRLIDWIMTLPEELEEVFRTEIHEFQREKQVEYMGSIERYGFNKGMEKGERKGLVEGTILALDAKFGPGGHKLAKKVRAIDDLEELRRFGDFLKKAKGIDEVRDYLK